MAKAKTKYSVAEFAAKKKISRQAVLKRINTNNLHKGYSVERVGKVYVIQKD